MVSHGATKDPARKRPSARVPDAHSTSIRPSRCTSRLRTARGPRNAATRCSASSASAAIAATDAPLSAGLPGVSSTTAMVASATAARIPMPTRLYWRSIRTVSTFFMTPPSVDERAALAAARDGTIVADLSHNALIAVSGDDAASFLHGQFTNDVESLGPGEAQWSGWCSPKGRLLATFLLARREGEFLLMLPAEIAPAFAKRLGMYVLRSKVKIADASAEWARFGIAGKAAHAAIAAIFGAAPPRMRMVECLGAVCIALDEQRFVVLAPRSVAEDLRVRLAQTGMPAGGEAWEWTGIQAGVPTIVAATQEAFIPQMANLDLVGGVSFRKGCYPGQEIVARTQYRGILKRRMARAHVAGDGVPKPGDNVYSASFGDQVAGTVVQAARSPDGGHDLLVVAQIESLQAGNLRLGSPEGPAVEIRETPALAAP